MLWCYQRFYWCVSLLIATNNDQGNWVSGATAAVVLRPRLENINKNYQQSSHSPLHGGVQSGAWAGQAWRVHSGGGRGGVTQRSRQVWRLELQEIVLYVTVPWKCHHTSRSIFDQNSALYLFLVTSKCFQYDQNAACRVWSIFCIDFQFSR